MAPGVIRRLVDLGLNLLTLGEDVFVSWASDHLKVPDLMRVACIPEDKRNPDRPVKWTVTLSQRLENSLAKIAKEKKPS